MLPLDSELTQLEKELGNLKIRIKTVKALQRKTSKLLTAISTLIGELPAAEIKNLKSAVLAVFPGDKDGAIRLNPTPQSPDDGHPISITSTDQLPVLSDPCGTDADATPELSLVLIQGGAEALPVKEEDDWWEPEYLDSPEEVEDTHTPGAVALHPEEDPRFLGFKCGQYYSIPLDEPVELTALYMTDKGVPMARTRFADGTEGTTRVGADYLRPLPTPTPTAQESLASLLGKIQFDFKADSDSQHGCWLVYGNHPLTGKPRCWGRVSQRLPGREEFYHSSQRGRINYFPTRLDAAKDLARIVLAEEATHNRTTAELKKFHGLGA